MANVVQCWEMQGYASGPGNTNKDYYMNMNSKKLENTSMEKDLGVIITSDLKSSQQCSQSYAKANRILGMIKTNYFPQIYRYIAAVV